MRNVLERLDPPWDELFSAEQERIVQRLDIGVDGMAIKLRVDGLANPYREIRVIDERTRRAAR